MKLDQSITNATDLDESFSNATGGTSSNEAQILILKNEIKNPSRVISCKGTVENPVIPSTASFTNFLNG